MKVLSLGTLRSKLVSDLVISLPMECFVRAGGVTLGADPASPLDALLAETIGAPVRVDFDASLLPLSPQFRGDIAQRYFEAVPESEAMAALPVAVVEWLLRQAGVSDEGAPDTLVVGESGAGRHLPSAPAASREEVEALALSLGTTLVTAEAGASSLDRLLESVFGPNYRLLILRAFQVLLVTCSTRLSGDAVEAYRKLEKHLIAGDNFDRACRELEGILGEAPSFIKFGVRLLRWRADLSGRGQANALSVLSSLDRDISQPDEREYSVLLGQFYVDLARYLQDIRGIELTDAVLSRINKLDPPLADTPARPGLVFLVEHRVGRSYYLRGEFREALRSYQSALDALARLDRADGFASAGEQVRLTRAEVLNSIGKVLTDLLSLRSAAACFAEAARLRLVLNARHAQAATIGSLAEVLARLGQYSEAESLYKKDLEACEEKDKLRVRNYLSVLKALSPDTANAEDAAKEFESVKRRYTLERDFAQASYAAVGRIMCAFRLSQPEAVDILWDEWGGLGESLPRGFITFIYGVVKGCRGDWGEATRLIREAAFILRSDAYVLEAAAALLELPAMAYAHISEEKGEPGTPAHESLTEAAARATLLKAGRLIQEFYAKRQGALAAFNYVLPQTLVPVQPALRELQDVTIPADEAMLDAIMAGFARLLSGDGLSSREERVRLVRDIQKRCHFWFDILKYAQNSGC